MKFLVVTDFRGSKYSKKLVEDFQKAIKHVGHGLCQAVTSDKTIIDTETVLFFAKTPAELAPYLFQPDIGFTNSSYGKNFDLIDIVVINGDYRYRPWSAEYLEVFLFDLDLHAYQNVHKNTKTITRVWRPYDGILLSLRNRSGQSCGHFEQEP